MFFNFNSTKLFFFFFLIFSTLISISSNSWLGCWIGLEINLMSFIPIMSNNKNLLNSEASLKYFLIQAIASINFLFIILINMINFKFFINDELIKLMINSSLLMKLGAAPFHLWFPNIMEGLNWMNCFILMTWQKISPMILLSYYYKINFLMMISCITVILGSLGGLNQTSLRKLLAFSSINHLGWLIMALMISENLWNFYFLIYSIMMMMMSLMFLKMNSYYINQLFYNNMNNLIKFFIFLNLLSLGGLPPFLGFFNKWIIINFMIMNNLYLLTFIFIMCALITLFFYIRIFYSTFMFNYLKLKWFKLYVKYYFMMLMSILSFLSIFSLILSTFFFYFN